MVKKKHLDEYSLLEEKLRKKYSEETNTLVCHDNISRSHVVLGSLKNLNAWVNDSCKLANKNSMKVIKKEKITDWNAVCSCDFVRSPMKTMGSVTMNGSQRKEPFNMFIR